MSRFESEKVVFLVSGGSTVDNALSVASELARVGVSSLLMDLSTGSTWLSSRFPDSYRRLHLPLMGLATAGRMTAFLHRLSRGTLAPGSVFVLAQDVGTLERYVSARIRGLGHRIALMPNGLVHTARPELGYGLRSRMRGVARSALAGRALLAGDGRWGSTRPDLILSWGTAWASVWEAAGVDPGSVRVVGCPRFDGYVAMPPPAPGKRVLLCSQPMWGSLGSLGFGERWYSWLQRQADGGVSVRIRYHQLELVSHRRRSARSGESAAARVPARTSMWDDLAWATDVVALASTTLVEALATGRRAWRVDPGRWRGGLVEASPFLRDSRLSTVDWNANLPEDLKAASGDGSLLADYLACRGEAARVAAEELVALLA